MVPNLKNILEFYGGFSFFINRVRHVLSHKFNISSYQKPIRASSWKTYRKEKALINPSLNALWFIYFEKEELMDSIAGQ